ncbi:hypothetical protein E1162_03115 [Rhodobacteraceae bacterium RKSG542]|uniref:hypothetical protein n=1 Tax=Pseudovibrio flavus TaxID=2529854 RepID=UPI0012BCCD19|nr:hypothetical protein [Pseudovibrio flavus]MTI16226.1 hypothetical protein [Pseudovibrio flavus]
METVVEGTIKNWPVSIMVAPLDNESGVSVYCSPEEIHEGRSTPVNVLEICNVCNGEFFSHALAMKHLRQNNFRVSID